VPLVNDHSIEQPPDETVLWRYVSLAKFVSMLKSRAIFFSRADRLGDPHEGAVSPLDNEEWAAALERLLEGIADHEEAIAELSTVRERARRWVYVNSWFASHTESAAMWDLYAAGGEGVAVQTTFGRLKSALNASEQIVFAGRVSYVDYQSAAIHDPEAVAPFFYKREAFAHEQEVRAAIFELPPSQDGGFPLDDDDNPVGLEIEVSLWSVIERIYTPPGAAEWFTEAIGWLARENGYTAAVVRSSMDDQPFF